jgi:hypothetical protein
MNVSSMTHTVFEYLYRDAANYKVYGALLLRGNFSEEYEAEIKAHCEGSEYFVAEQLDIPALCELLWAQSNGPSEDDHGWHEFICLRVAEVDEVKDFNEWGALDDLLGRFRAAQKWDLNLSPNA